MYPTFSCLDSFLFKVMHSVINLLFLAASRYPRLKLLFMCLNDPVVM